MPSRDLLYLSRADVEAAAVPMTSIIDHLEVAFREKGLGRVEMPPKPGIHPGPTGGDNFIHAMPAFIGALGAAGVKWVGGFPENLRRGLPYSTGAASAVAAKRLARPAASSFGILGCGVQARTNLEAIAAVVPSLESVRAYDIHLDRAARYCAEMGPAYPAIKFSAVATPRAAVEGTDIVVTAGPIRARPSPVIEPEWLAEGSVGLPLDYDSYWKPEAMAAAERFYTDDTAQLLHTREAGVYFRRVPRVFADLGEVVAGLKDGRRHDRERLLCMSLGIAIDDMATAPLVLEGAVAKGLGTRLPL